jgi:hypothetical protein
MTAGKTPPLMSAIFLAVGHLIIGQVQPMPATQVVHGMWDSMMAGRTEAGTRGVAIMSGQCEMQNRRSSFERREGSHAGGYDAIYRILVTGYWMLVVPIPINAGVSIQYQASRIQHHVGEHFAP